MSTSGESPVTVIVSSTAPTASSALTVATIEPLRLIPSRTSDRKPGRVNVTEYSPGRRLVMVNRPPPSVTAVRTCSISAGLRASTVTPGSTPPVSSVTRPVRPTLCAHAPAGSSSRQKTAVEHVHRTLSMRRPPQSAMRAGTVRAQAATDCQELTLAQTPRSIMAQCRAVNRAGAACLHAASVWRRTCLPGGRRGRPHPSVRPSPPGRADQVSRRTRLAPARQSSRASTARPASGSAGTGGRRAFCLSSSGSYPLSCWPRTRGTEGC